MDDASISLSKHARLLSTASPGSDGAAASPQSQWTGDSLSSMSEPESVAVDSLGHSRGERGKASPPSSPSSLAFPAPLSSSSPSTPTVLVKGCPPSCSCRVADPTGSAPWCSFDVRIPHTNWHAVFESNPHSYNSFLMGKGYERIYFPEKLQVYLVQNPAHVKAALQLLKASMKVSIGNCNVKGYLFPTSFSHSRLGCRTDLLQSTSSGSPSFSPSPKTSRCRAPWP